MLRHLVLMDLDDDADDAAVDAGLAEGNADLALLVVVEDAGAWRTYQEHPSHQRVVAEHVRPIVTGRTAAQLVAPD